MLDDKAIFNLYNVLSSGDTTFFIALAFEDIAFKATMVLLENGNFQVEFDVPKKVEEKIDIEDFFAKPAVLAIPKPVNKKDIPDFNIIVSNADVENVSAHINAKDDNIPIHVEVTIRGFRTFCEENERERAKHTAFIRFKSQIYSPTNKGILYDLTTHNNQDNPCKNAISFQIGQSNFLFYYYILSKEEGYFVIKSQDELLFSDFIKIVDSVRSAYALLNGYYMADSVLYVSRTLKRQGKLAIEYRCENSSISSNYPLLDYHIYKNIDRTQLLLSPDMFEKLIRLLFKSSELRRSCVLITQSACLDNISNGCLASVAIETITGYFMKNHSSQKPKMFENKDIFRHIKYELEKVVKGSKKYATSIGINIDNKIWEKLNSKLGQFNEMPNAVKLSAPFDDNNIRLFEDEEECLNCRNHYLHGNTPKIRMELLKNLTTDELYIFVSHTLRMLAGLLLLKQAGFNGRVVDWGKTIIVYERGMKSGHGIKDLSWLHRTVSGDDNKDWPYE